MSKKALYDDADSKLQRVSKTIGAITAIVAAATAVCTWVAGQFQNVVSAQIDDLKIEMEKSDKQTEILPLVYS